MHISSALTIKKEDIYLCFDQMDGYTKLSSDMKKLYAMIDFSEFDQQVKQNRFWTEPIEDVNRKIKEAQDEDAVGRSGVSLIIGCPLPPEIQRKILEVQRKFDQTLSDNQVSASVKWREDLTALHITVYGLVKPDDYRRGMSWSVPDHIMDKVRAIVSKHLPFKLVLQGLGILGRGAVAVRISNSRELNQIREVIEGIQGVSKRGFGERLNQMIIGRFLPPLTDNDRSAIKRSLDDLINFSISELNVVSLELVHYKHEFLNQLYGQQVIP